MPDREPLEDRLEEARARLRATTPRPEDDVVPAPDAGAAPSPVSGPQGPRSRRRAAGLLRRVAGRLSSRSRRPPRAS